MTLPPRLRGVAGPIALALLVDLALSVLLSPGGFTLVAFTFRAGFALLVGWWLGTRAWPRRGRALTVRILRRTLRARGKRLLVLTDRPDGAGSRGRRLFDVVAFAAGVSVILTAILPLFGVHPGLVLGLSGLLVLGALWAAFALVPYWTSARLGLRVVDAATWTVTPLSRKYADTLRLSNGAILLLAMAVFVNLAVRAGASQDEALVRGLGYVLSVIVSVLVVAATGVAWYADREPDVLRAVAEEALAAGVRDGRAMPEHEFLPRLR